MNLWFPKLMLDLTLCLWHEEGSTKRERETDTGNRCNSERGDMTYEQTVRTLMSFREGGIEFQIAAAELQNKPASIAQNDCPGLFSEIKLVIEFFLLYHIITNVVSQSSQVDTLAPFFVIDQIKEHTFCLFLFVVCSKGERIVDFQGSV